MRLSPAIPENTRPALLEAAIRAFARHGYAGTSILHVLAETGLSKPTLYYHFKSKAGLFRAILDHAYDECFHQMRAASESSATGALPLEAVALALFEFATRHADLTRLVFASLFAAPGEIPAECLDPARRRRNFELVRGLMDEARVRGVVHRGYEPDDLAHAFLGSVSHRVRSHLLAPAGALDSSVARRVVLLFLNGARHSP